MSLRKIKTDMTKLKKDVGHYGRKAHFGEITFSNYYIDGVKVESNPVLFCRLSEQYYTKIHNVPNPVKAELKRWCLTSWVWYHNNGVSTRALEEKTATEDKEFNARFNTAWNDIIKNGDFTNYNKLRKIYELRENR